MTFIERSWLRLPIAIRAIATGVAVAAIGTMPWAWLVSANMRYQSAVPWSVPIMAAYVGLYWVYFVRGSGWPRSTAERRRVDSRVNWMPVEVWGPALLAGVLGLASVLLFQGVLGRLVALPEQRNNDLGKYSGV